ncbi:YceD family protein [Rhabdaerophilum calidifontis]|uniref:YceD family protein n=1 Tax=Rhabdaerophilum calidifontis TaxID=2604328 RepID=UPI001239A824|nr:DUF177 domain-containing protein [Rhabdaerophilum calidifontis]
MTSETPHPAKSGAAAPPFSHPLAVATLPASLELTLRPDAEARARIARSLGLFALDDLAAAFRIEAKESGLVTVEGRIAARFQPFCVVTLDPFPDAIDEPVAIRFAPEALVAKMTARAEADAIEDFEPPDVIENGVIDLGAVAVEFLALALDPYPRKPGAEFQGLSEGAGHVSPFEALKVLKRDPS